MVITFGGGEYFDLRTTLRMIMQAQEKRRVLMPIAPAYLRLYNLWFRQSRGGFPLSTKWLDLLAVNRTCALDSLPRIFDLLPGRLNQYLDSPDVFK